MIFKAKVTVSGWLFPEGSGFWSLWIFFFSFFFFFNLVNKKVDDALQSLPPACPLPAPSMN